MPLITKIVREGRAIFYLWYVQQNQKEFLMVAAFVYHSYNGMNISDAQIIFQTFWWISKWNSRHALASQSKECPLPLEFQDATHGKGMDVF